MRTCETINEDIKAIDDRRRVLFEQKEPIDNELKTLYRQREKLADELATAQLSGNLSDDELLLYHLEHVDGVKRYDAAMTYWRDMGFACSGYYPDTQQRGLQIMMTRDKPESLQKTLAGLKRIIPVLKPLKDNNKVISIFEHTCSEYGCYSLIITPEEKYQIGLMRHHRASTETTFDDLEAALTYIQRVHYYDTIDD